MKKTAGRISEPGFNLLIQLDCSTDPAWIQSRLVQSEKGVAQPSHIIQKGWNASLPQRSLMQELTVRPEQTQEMARCFRRRREIFRLV